MKRLLIKLSVFTLVLGVIAIANAEPNIQGKTVDAALRVLS